MVSTAQRRGPIVIRAFNDLRYLDLAFIIKLFFLPSTFQEGVLIRDSLLDCMPGMKDDLVLRNCMPACETDGSRLYMRLEED